MRNARTLRGRTSPSAVALVLSALFAAHDNPYILRAMPYAGDGSATTAIGNGVVTYQGNNAATDWNSGAGTGSRQTTLELLAPTSQDP